MSLSLLGLIISLAPTGLDKLYTRNSADLVIKSLISDLNHCATRARVKGLLSKVGMPGCNIQAPDGYQVKSEYDDWPIFYPDGTSNGRALLLIKSDQKITIKVDRLTSQIAYQANEN